MTKKILITGANGLVGSEAVDFFREKGWEVIGIDNNMRSYMFGVKQDKPELDVDIRYESSIDRLFRDHTFDAIIHAAAQPSHDYSKENVLEDFDINARGTLLLLEAARKYCPSAVFVHCSTDKVYGEGMNRPDLQELDTRYHHDEPFDEFTHIEPALSPFGVGKLASDFYAQEYAAQGWLKTGIFRMGCITGRRHKGAEMHGFMSYLVKCIQEGRVYRVFGYKGKQVRDQIHSYDLVNAFYHFICDPRPGQVYNMGGGPERSLSILEAVDLITDATGKNAQLEMLEEPRFGDRIWDVHDMGKFRSHYPEWDYKYSLADIIEDLCAS